MLKLRIRCTDRKASYYLAYKGLIFHKHLPPGTWRLTLITDRGLAESEERVFRIRATEGTGNRENKPNNLPSNTNTL